MSKKVIICGVDTSTLPRLTQQQSRQMLVDIHSGDIEARSHFITANFRLVLSIIHRYSKYSSNLDDLFQIGCVGLIKSIDNFDISLDVSFSTYAVPMIIGEIRRFLRESNSLRVSRGIRDIAFMALHTREQLENVSDNEVSVSDIASTLNLPVFRVVYCLNAISDPVSLSDKVYNNEDDNMTIMDQISDKKCNENIWADSVSLEQAIAKLSMREREIIMMRYYQDKTQIEISNEVGISQAQVSRLEKNAVAHLLCNMS